MNIYLLNYNNYYNRICKKEDTLTDYLNYQVGDTIQGVNFNPNDGVNTELIVNTNQRANYLLAVEDNIINSRWFIIESNRLRNGQHKLMLRRDLIADNYNDIVNAPCFIEKATLNDSDPAIFNKENMTFNQIKTSETELKDETNSAWIVGYIPKNSFQQDTEIKGDIILKEAADITVQNINNWEYSQYQTTNFIPYIQENDVVYNIYVWTKTRNVSTGIISNSPGKISFYRDGLADTQWVIKNTQVLNGWAIDYYNQYPDEDTPENQLCFNNPIARSAMTTVATNLVNNYNTNTLHSLVKNYIGFHTQAETDTFLNLNNKIIYDTSSGLYWKVIINTETEPGKALLNTTNYPVTAGNLFNTMNTSLNRNPKDGLTIINEPGNKSFSYRLRNTINVYSLRLEQVKQEVKVTINNKRYHLENQPYDLFCIPYSDSLNIYKNNQLLFKSNKSIAINLGTQITASVGEGNVYDIQLLPYCPVRYMLTPNGDIDIKNSEVHYITDNNGNNVGVILWATNSAFTFNIPFNINITNKKIENETDIWRLCSPNYNGQFEFSPSMNNGIQYFNVDCDYKPFSPYIHINPNFSELYGQDFNDARGLICSGDFSLPKVTNAWANYQQNNKNYEQIFNREIQNMQVTHKYEMIQGGVQAIAGVAQGAVSGAALGGVGGAIAGGVASLAGGVADQVINQKLYNEALDYKKDLYGMQLGNIKAIPNSISKVSSYNPNNKIFPILEYYTCTETEKQALKNKIKYNGMTVGRIGTINEFLQPDYSYIKGKLIRLETIEDTNYLNEIASEIYKGVFIK